MPTGPLFLFNFKKIVKVSIWMLYIFIHDTIRNKLYMVGCWLELSLSVKYTRNKSWGAWSLPIWDSGKTVKWLIERSEASSPEVENCKNFILEQIRLIARNKVHRRYSPDSMVFFSLLHSISPDAYNFFQLSINLVMPHPTTIRMLCAGLCFSPYYEQFDENFFALCIRENRDLWRAWMDR